MTRLGQTYRAPRRLPGFVAAVGGRQKLGPGPGDSTGAVRRDIGSQDGRCIGFWLWCRPSVGDMSKACLLERIGELIDTV